MRKAIRVITGNNSELEPKCLTELSDVDANDFLQEMSILKDDEIVPAIRSKLRHNILTMPKEILQASGIMIFGRKIRSLVFTTDLAIIKNCDADAV